MSDPVENVVELGVPVERVWEALTTKKGLQSFLADQVELEPGVGGSVQLGWGDFMLEPSTIEAWDPPHRLRLVGNGVVEEWILEAKGGSTVVRLIFNGYGDVDWDEMYDPFEATSRLILDYLRAWLDQHGGQPPVADHVTADVEGDLAAAWTRALGADCLGVTADPEALSHGTGVRIRLTDAPPLEARLTVYGIRNEAVFELPELDHSRLLLMVRSGEQGRTTVTLSLTTYGLADEVRTTTVDRLRDTAARLEAA